MGGILEWIRSAIEFVRQIKDLIAGRSKSTPPTEAAVPEPPSPTIPEPSGRFAFSRAAMIDAEEVTAVGEVMTRCLELQLAADHRELMIGDLLSFRVELLDGREPVRSWGLARVICPQRDVIVAKVFRSPRFEHVHAIAVDQVIHVPRAGIGHLYRVTASGAGA